MFQSQTGSQALSDKITYSSCSCWDLCFNPKREARPSQTKITYCGCAEDQEFQSQTGSQALSDKKGGKKAAKPARFNPKREARPSQTWISK